MNYFLTAWHSIWLAIGAMILPILHFIPVNFILTGRIVSVWALAWHDRMLARGFSKKIALLAQKAEKMNSDLDKLYCNELC